MTMSSSYSPLTAHLIATGDGEITVVTQPLIQNIITDTTGRLVFVSQGESGTTVCVHAFPSPRVHFLLRFRRYPTICATNDHHSSLCVQKASRKEKTEDDKTLNRKQQLLEELNAINKVIERKKQKKVAKDDF